MDKPLIRLDDVTFQYPDGTQALKHISLQIKKGRKIALLGNNGAGKSTLLLQFNAILAPTSGQLIYKGESITYKRSEKNMLRQQVGIVFQDPDTQLFASTVFEDIQYGPRNMGLSQEEVISRVEYAMHLTETDSLMDKPPHLLSLGQKKRVAIAGVLAMNPELMILDEPTAGLDPYYTEKILDILNTIFNPNRSILISTHDVDFAYEWADELWIMSDGHLISVGSPVEVFQNTENLSKSHLKKPWIMDVFDQIKDLVDTNEYPSSRKELMMILQKINIKVGSA